MKLIIDAQLPKSICDYFNDCDCIHTGQLEKGNNTKDSVINTLSVSEQRVLITKDSDFYYSYLATQKPFKLVLVKLGNVRMKDLKIYFQNNSHHIKILMEKHSLIILEKEKISILV